MSRRPSCRTAVMSNRSSCRRVHHVERRYQGSAICDQDRKSQICCQGYTRNTRVANIFQTYFEHIFNIFSTYFQHILNIFDVQTYFQHIFDIFSTYLMFCFGFAFLLRDTHVEETYFKHIFNIFDFLFSLVFVFDRAAFDARSIPGSRFQGSGISRISDFQDR